MVQRSMRSHVCGKRLVCVLGLALAFALGGCGEDKKLTITKLSPPSGSYYGGDAVTIHGTGFQQGETKGVKVYFGNRAAKVLGFNGDTKLRVEAPGGKVGEKVDVTIVFEASGRKELKEAYEYIDPQPLDVNALTNEDKETAE